MPKLNHSVLVGKVFKDNHKGRSRTVEVRDVGKSTVEIHCLESGKDTVVELKRFLSRFTELEKKVEAKVEATPPTVRKIEEPKVEETPTVVPTPTLPSPNVTANTSKAGPVVSNLHDTVN